MKAVVVLALVVSLMAVTSVGGASGASAKKSITFHLVEKSVGFNFVDNPPRQGGNAPPLIGDLLAFTSDLQTTSGAHAGQLNATCTVTRGGVNATGPCYGVFSLAGGTIAGIAKFGQGNTTMVAVVGGTGAYEGVTGSVTSVSRGQDSQYTDDTVHLIYPS
jgi:hypothetical protein